jgi:hypothetical protein
MSELMELQEVRKNRVPTAFLLILATMYALVFAAVFRHYAYAEPGGFPVFYTSGKLARFDLSGLYNQHLQDIFHPENGGTGYFFHLPYELLLLIPLSYLPQLPAYGIWVTVNIAGLLGVAMILRRHFAGFELLVPFAFAPTLSLLLNGQDIGILMLLVTLAFDKFLSGKDLHAGLLMAMGLFKFPLVVPLAAIIGLRHGKVLVGFVLGSIPLLTASAMAVGRQGIRDYLTLTHGTDAKEDPAILVNLRGIVGKTFGLHTALVIGLSIVCIAVVVSMRLDRVRLFSMAAIVTVLVSWHAHLYDALMLLIPMGWMMNSDRKWMRFAASALLVGTVPLLVTYAHAYLLSAYLFVLFGVLVWDLMRNRTIANRHF